MPTVTYNGQEYSTESQIGKEALKHERPVGYRPENHPYPRMLYKAFKGTDGLVRADAGRTLGRDYFASDADYRTAVNRDEAFNESCRTIVGTEREHQVARDNGWRDSAEEAIAYCKHFETIVKGEAAAEQAYRDKNMSARAQAEAKAANDATPDILPEIPESHKIDKRYKAYRDSMRASLSQAS